jgi:hypothetical protein
MPKPKDPRLRNFTAKRELLKKLIEKFGLVIVKEPKKFEIKGDIICIID